MCTFSTLQSDLGNLPGHQELHNLDHPMLQYLITRRNADPPRAVNLWSPQFVWQKA